VWCLGLAVKLRDRWDVSGHAKFETCSLKVSKIDPTKKGQSCTPVPLLYRRPVTLFISAQYSNPCFARHQSRTLNSAHRPLAMLLPRLPLVFLPAQTQRHTLNLSSRSGSLRKTVHRIFNHLQTLFLLFLSVQKERAFIFKRLRTLLFFVQKEPGFIFKHLQTLFLPKKYVFSFFSSTYKLFFAKSYFF
jgi:hypothetical protein